MIVSARVSDEPAVEIARIAEPFIETCHDLRTLLIATDRSLASYVEGEVDYWTGAFAGARL